jgi:uncharacterized protein
MQSTNNNLKISEFNYIINRPDCVLCYNAATGCFLMLDSLSKAVLEGGGDIKLLPTGTAELLEESGFLVKGDERSAIKARLGNSKKYSHYSHIVITPTIACNFRCDYCFQNDMRDTKKISSEVLGKIIQYIRVALKDGNEPIKISWFGGEPLLAMESIVNFNEELVDALGTNNHRITQDIITNGILLDKFMVSRLLKYGVNKAQVSFDSLVYERATKRGVIEEKGEPSIITRNIITALDAGMQINVRINVDSRNANQIDQINDALDKFKIRKYSYYARVEGVDTEEAKNIEIVDLLKSKEIKCKSATYSGATITRKAFAEQEKDLLFNSSNFTLLLKKLTPRTHFCGATDGSMVVISPDGGVSRCWNSAGRENEEICNILDDNAYDYMHTGPVNEAWNQYSPFEHESCKSCKVLPLCMGGCCQPRVMLDINEPPCIPVKFYIDELVQYVGTHLNVEKFKK